MRAEDTLAGWRGGWGVNILEDARHSSVHYICNYFVVESLGVAAANFAFEPYRAIKLCTEKRGLDSVSINIAALASTR